MPAWTTKNGAAVERCAQVLADVRGGGAADLATLSVAVRELRNLIDATGSAAAPATEPGANGSGIETPVGTRREA